MGKKKTVEAATTAVPGLDKNRPSLYLEDDDVIDGLQIDDEVELVVKARVKGMNVDEHREYKEDGKEGKPVKHVSQRLEVVSVKKAGETQSSDDEDDDEEEDKKGVKKMFEKLQRYGKGVGGAVLLLVCMGVSAMALPRHAKRADNGGVIMLDTVWVTGTNTAYSQAFWVSEGGYHAITLEMQDTSAAGFASDSGALKIELMQGFTVGTDFFDLFPSKAHPDSTTWPNGSRWVMDDSLDIAEACTTCTWYRAVKVDTSLSGDTLRWTRTEDVDSVYYSAAKTAMGAKVYWSLAPDFSDFVVLKLTGLSRNRKGAGGLRCIVRAYQQAGEPVKAR